VTEVKGGAGVSRGTKGKRKYCEKRRHCKKGESERKGVTRKIVYTRPGPIPEGGDVRKQALNWGVELSFNAT